MSGLSTVTIGTDGNVDYVALADGTRYALGPVSVLQLVTQLVASTRQKQLALEAFNKSRQAIVTLDVGALFEYLAPVRARWAADSSSLMPRTDRTGPHRGNDMSTPQAFTKKLAEIEQAVAQLAAQPTEAGCKCLTAAVADIRLPNFGDQSKNNAFEHLGPPKVDTVTDPGAYTPPPNVTHPLGKTASFSAFKANIQATETILAQAEATDAKIDALVAAGKKFGSAKAKADVLNVVSTLRDMVGQVDLAEPWVAVDIQKLAKRSEELYSLFSAAKL